MVHQYYHEDVQLVTDPRAKRVGFWAFVALGIALVAFIVGPPISTIDGMFTLAVFLVSLTIGVILALIALDIAIGPKVPQPVTFRVTVL